MIFMELLAYAVVLLLLMLGLCALAVLLAAWFDIKGRMK